ncbi:hypothetical protein P22_2736 [Propionispora sp. 2/2-37]|nr:hypothetical protein P22_2736 [Propionispora sp. 2/2-37]
MIKQMRKDKIAAQIIILSAFADFSYAQQAIAFGVNQYILKPVSVSQLLDTLQEIKNDISEKDEVLAKGKAVSPLIQRVCHIIGSSQGLTLSLSEIAAQLKITPEYLGTQFHKEVGCHFSIYIKNKRLDYAKLLLKNSNSRISDIAARVGYNDAKYFSHLFKKETGLLPIEYRRQGG